VSHGHGRELFFEVDLETSELQYLPERPESNAPAASEEFSLRLFQMCRDRVYVFEALRFGVQDNVIGPGFTLHSDASNAIALMHPGAYEEDDALVVALLSVFRVGTSRAAPYTRWHGHFRRADG
jgi:hypothetical protein